MDDAVRRWESASTIPTSGCVKAWAWRSPKSHANARPRAAARALRDRSQEVRMQWRSNRGRKSSALAMPLVVG